MPFQTGIGGIPEPTPTVPRTYVAPDATGTATGTSGADDIFATGSGQTLIGNGGADVFNIGTHTDAKIVESGSGISTVSTWASDYTLPAGVDDLTALGNYPHHLVGNGGTNWIQGSPGDDVIEVGGTNHVGGGSCVFVGGGGHDTFVFRDQPPGYEITDFQAGAGGDVARLETLPFANFDQVKAAMEQTADGVVLHLNPNAPGFAILFDGTHIADFTAANFAFVNPSTTPTPTPTPVPTPTPTPTPGGTDTLVLHLSEDAFQGDAQFTVTVDGVQPAHSGVQSVTTLHSTGQFEDFTFSGSFGPGPHTVAINFLNDAWGGTPATDRNLYVGGIDFDGVHFPGTAAQNNANLGITDPNDAPMFVNGTVTFSNVTGTPSPGPAPNVITGTQGNDILTGTAGPDDIRALGGDDVLAGLAGADILEGGPGLDLADYSASPAGVNVNLAAGAASGGDAQGDTLASIEAVRGSPSGDVITGDAGPNLLEGGGGNDQIHGGAGDDILISGDRGSEITPTLNTFTQGELFPSHMDGTTLLDGGPGNDTLLGGAHTTYFIHAGNGSDTIFNYVAGGTVDIDGYAIGDLATLKSHATAGFGFIDVALGNGETLEFLFGPHPGERSLAELDTTNFVFTNVQPTPPPSGEGPTPTPTEPRAFLAPGAGGVAQGTAAAEDIFATGDGQTLIGGGGDDIFHVGTHTGLTIQESDPGISTVSTWSSSYTLNDGIDNLTAQGAYGHTLTGNDGDNVITGGPGNDIINGHGGTDLLLGGGGTDTFVVDEVRRFEILNANAPHIGDFDPASELVDLHLYLQAAGISDPDPFATHKIALQANAAGGTDVVDNTQNFSAGGAPIPVPIITIDHVAPSGLHASSFILH